MLIVDDQELVRTGFRLFLETQDDLEVVGEAGDGAEAIERMRELRPGRRPDGHPDARDGRRRGDGRLTAAGIEPRPRVLVLTTFDLDEYVFGALRAGASRVPAQGRPPRMPAGGDPRRRTPARPCSRPSITAPADRRLRRAAPTRSSRRRRSSSAHAARARGARAGSARAVEQRDREALVVTEATVKTHVGASSMKLDLRDRVQAVVFAYEHGIVAAGDRT